MLVHPSGIDLSTAPHLRCLSRELAARGQKIGTRWQRLTPGRQAPLALAHLRCGDTYAQLAAGFDVGIATIRGYVRETIETLAVQAPTLPVCCRWTLRHACPSASPRSIPSGPAEQVLHAVRTRLPGPLGDRPISS